MFVYLEKNEGGSGVKGRYCYANTLRVRLRCETNDLKRSVCGMMKRKQKSGVSSNDKSHAKTNHTVFSERLGSVSGLGPGSEPGSEPGPGEDWEEPEESESEERSEEGSEKEMEESDEDRGSEDVKKELSNMSFEDVMKLQNKVGTKVYNKVKHGTGGKTGARDASKKKRLNKNRPMEMSSKKPVPFLRQVVSGKKATQRDPRFDDLSGEYKADIFEKTYKFINDIKHQEKKVVQKKLKKTKNERQKDKLQFLLKRMENQERARVSREQQRETELQFKKQQRERANQGQAPLFLKKSEKKKLQLLEKYQGLKKSGKLENFLSKKRKRNAGKDRKKLPPQQHTNAP